MMTMMMVAAMAAVAAAMMSHKASFGAAEMAEFYSR